MPENARHDRPPVAILLASSSPRRQALIALGGWDFRIEPAEVDESRLPGEAPRDYVLRLAGAKAQAVSGRLEDPGWVVLGADTAVVDGDDILGKPSGPAQAAAMLDRLRGRTHQVYTAVAAIRDGRLESEVCVTEVPMRPYSQEEIDRYVASGDPLDKAGAYAIQNANFRPVAHMQGCYANVVGLPLCHLVRLLGRLGLPPRADVPGGCQETLQYDCPVFAAILRHDA